jgi:hypothetical protein
MTEYQENLRQKPLFSSWYEKMKTTKLISMISAFVLILPIFFSNNVSAGSVGYSPDIRELTDPNLQSATGCTNTKFGPVRCIYYMNVGEKDYTVLRVYNSGYASFWRTMTINDAGQATMTDSQSRPLEPNTQYGGVEGSGLKYIEFLPTDGLLKVQDTGQMSAPSLIEICSAGEPCDETLVSDTGIVITGASAPTTKPSELPPETTAAPSAAPAPNPTVNTQVITATGLKDGNQITSTATGKTYTIKNIGGKLTWTENGQAVTSQTSLDYLNDPNNYELGGRFTSGATAANLPNINVGALVAQSSSEGTDYRVVGSQHQFQLMQGEELVPDGVYVIGNERGTETPITVTVLYGYVYDSQGNIMSGSVAANVLTSNLNYLTSTFDKKSEIPPDKFNGFKNQIEAAGGTTTPEQPKEVVAAPVTATAPAELSPGGDAGTVQNINGILYYIDLNKQVSIVNNNNGVITYTSVDPPKELSDLYSDLQPKSTAPSFNTMTEAKATIKNDELMVDILTPNGVMEVDAYTAFANKLVTGTLTVNYDGKEFELAPGEGGVLTGTSWISFGHTGGTTVKFNSKTNELAVETVNDNGQITESMKTTMTQTGMTKEKTSRDIIGGENTVTTTTFNADGEETGETTARKDSRGNIFELSGTETISGGTKTTKCDENGCIQRTVITTKDADGKVTTTDTAQYCNNKPEICKVALDKGDKSKIKECKEANLGSVLCKGANGGTYPGSSALQGAGAATGKVLFGATRYAALGNKLSAWILPQGWLDWWQEYISLEFATKWLSTDTWSSSICRVSSLQSDSEGVAVVYNVGATGESEAVISVQGMRIPIENVMNEAGVISTEYIYKMEFYVKNNDKNNVISFMPRIDGKALFNTSIIVGKNWTTANYRGDKMAVMKLKNRYEQLCLYFSEKPKGTLEGFDKTLCTNFVEPDETGPVSTIVPESFSWEDEGKALTQTAAATGTTINPIAASQTQTLRDDIE